MKKTLFGLLICSLFLVTSCKDDECTGESVSGTYVGTNDCDPNDVMELTLTVTGTGSDITVVGDDGSSWSTTLNGCDSETFEQSFDIFGITIDAKFDLSFNDTSVTFRNETTSLGSTETCTIVLDKQ